jgi:uncharacterized protein YggE
MRAILALLPLAVAAPLAAQQPVPPSPVGPPVPSVVTSAQGEARVTPDRAIIFIGVQTRAATANAAAAENARKQQAVIDTLRALGIAANQFSTVEFNVYPDRVYNPERGDKAPRITGYNVSNTIRVEVRKLEQLGTLLDAALAKGANGINSLQFYASTADQARRAALAEAVGRAQGDADAIARAAGRCGVDEIIELSTAEAVRPVVLERSMALRAQADQQPTPINPGEQTLSVTVTGRWRVAAQGASCSARNR